MVFIKQKANDFNDILIDSDQPHSSKTSVTPPRVILPVSKEEKCLILRELLRDGVPSQDIKRGKICSTIRNIILVNKDTLEPNIREYYSNMDNRKTYQRVYLYIRSVTRTLNATIAIMQKEKDPDVKMFLKNWITKYFESQESVKT